MAVNRDIAQKAIKIAEREFRNAVRSLEEKDHAGSLKYLQESVEYAVKAVLMAYGVDYPKIHATGRFLRELDGRLPRWFLERVQDIADVADSLARGRPRFRYPYEYPPEQYDAVAKEILPRVKKALESCHELIRQLFG